MEEFPTDAAPSGPDTRPLDVRVMDKNWKTRASAYEELARQLKTSMSDDPLFDESGPWLSKMAADSNANALDAALDAILVYVDLAPVNCVKHYGDKVCSNIIDKTFGARPQTLARGKAIILKMMEVDDPNMCTAILISQFGDKKTKIPPVCLEVIKEGMGLFGARTFPIKDIISSLANVLNGTNSGARDAAMNLMVELSRWIGRAPFNNLLDNIRSTQKADFERLTAERDAEGTPVPTLYLRKDRAKALSEASSGKAQQKAAEIDTRDFIEEVDLNKRLKASDYATLIKEEKWSEHVKALQLIIDILGPTPKMKSGTDVDEIVRVLNGFLRQGHIQLQTMSLKVLNLFTDGLRAEFASTLRPLTDTIILKAKEKKLIPEIQSLLFAGVKYCFQFDSLSEGVCEHIKNKKGPPHERIALMELASKVLKECPERMSNDCMKPLADALIASCEDSDAKVREACSVSLADLTPVVKSRGRVCAEAYRMLMSLEQTAPRVFKKMQAASQAASNLPVVAEPAVPPPQKITTEQNSKQPVAKPTENASKPAAKAKAAAPSSTAAVKTSTNKPTSTGAKKTSDDSKEDDNVDDLNISLEDAMLALGSLNIPGWETEFQANMNSSNWQIKVDTLSLLAQTIKNTSSGGRLFSSLIAYLKSNTSNFKISMVNVVKAIIQLIVTAVSSSGDEKISKSAAWEVIRAFADKLSDKKLSDSICSLLTSFAEAISPTFVVKRMNALMDTIKSPQVHQQYLEWLNISVGEFGANSFPITTIAAFCQVELENKATAVRTAAVQVMGSLYHQLGPRLQSVAINDGMKPALKSLLEAEFNKVGYDQTAAAKVTRFLKGEEKSSSASGNVGGGIPRVDLGSALDRNVANDLMCTDGKDSWQLRKVAMEVITQQCERSGHYIEYNKAFIEFLKSLKARMNDTQANLKPIAVLTLGHMIASIELENASKALKAFASAILGGMADNKKAMRDSTISALQMIVTLGKGNEASSESLLLAVLVPSITESLQNPVCRPELLQWLAAQLPNTVLPKGTEFADLLNSLVSCLQDKTAAVRTFTEQCITTMFSKGYITRSMLDKSVRDLPPASLRAIQPIIDRMNPATTATSIPTSKATSRGNNVEADVERKEPSKASTIQIQAIHDIDPPQPTPTGSVMKKTNKAKRLDDLVKNNVKWPQPPEEPGETEYNALRATWEPLLCPEIVAILFPDYRPGTIFGLSGPNHDSAIGGVHELLSMLNDDAVGASSKVSYPPNISLIAVQHTDLMIRWASLALAFREASKGLLEILLLIATIFKKMNSNGMQLHEYEISCILPSLIDKSGHKSERHRSAFKIAVDASRSVVSPSRLCQLLIQGLSCKNKKSRVVCVEEIDRLVDNYGPQALGKQGIREIGAMLESKDNDVSGRNACLDLCFTLYLSIGSDKGKLLKLLGDISDKTVPMIEHRIKEKLKTHPGATANHNNASVASFQSAETTVANPMQNSVVKAPPVIEPELERVFELKLTPTATVPSRFDKEDINPFRLEMTPPAPSQTTSKPPLNNNPLTLDISRGSSPAAYKHFANEMQPPSKPVGVRKSEVVAEGIFADVVEKVDEMLNTKKSMNADSILAGKDYLKLLFSILSNEWSKEKSIDDDMQLQKHTPLLIDRLIKTLKFGFDCIDYNSSDKIRHELNTIDVGLISVSIACLFIIVQRKDLFATVADDNKVISDIIDECVRRVTDRRLNPEILAQSAEFQSNPVYSDGIRQITDGLNAVLLRITCEGHVKSGNVLCVLLELLSLCIVEKENPPPGKAKMNSECSKPLSKLLLKVLSLEAERGDRAYKLPSVDSMRLMSVLHIFFNSHPAVTPKDDIPYCCAKTILSQLIKFLGISEIQKLCAVLKIPAHSFIHCLATKMAEADGNNVAKSGEPVSDELANKIVIIIDEITGSRDKLVPIKKLHALLKNHPNVDINKYLQRISSTFRRYVIDTLAKLDNSPQPPSESESASAPVEKSQTVSTSDESEALRILEGLRARPTKSSSFNNGTNSNTLPNVGKLEKMQSTSSMLSSPFKNVGGENEGATPTKQYMSSPRSSIHDKIRGTLNSLTASLSLDTSSSRHSMGGNNVNVSSSDSDLAARLNRLKQLEGSNSAI